MQDTQIDGSSAQEGERTDNDAIRNHLRRTNVTDNVTDSVTDKHLTENELLNTNVTDNVTDNVTGKHLTENESLNPNVETNVETNGTPISHPDQYLGSMQVDEDGKRFASSDSCQHVNAGHANRRIQPPG